MASTVEQWLITAPQPVFEVILDVVHERSAQDEKWGEQNHPDGTGAPSEAAAALRSQMVTDRKARLGTLTYADTLREKVHEAFAETDPARLRGELVQAAAVTVQWIEKLDREATQ